MLSGQITATMASAWYLASRRKGEAGAIRPSPVGVHSNAATAHNRGVVGFWGRRPHLARAGPATPNSSSPSPGHQRGEVVLFPSCKVGRFQEAREARRVGHRRIAAVAPELEERAETAGLTGDEGSFRRDGGDQYGRRPCWHRGSNRPGASRRRHYRCDVQFRQRGFGHVRPHTLLVRHVGLQRHDRRQCRRPGS